MDYELNTLLESGPRGRIMKALWTRYGKTTLMIIFSICHIHTALMTQLRRLGSFQSKRKMIFHISYFMTRPWRPSTLQYRRKIFINIVFICHIYTALMTRPQGLDTLQNRRKIIIFHISGSWVFKVKKNYQYYYFYMSYP